MLVDCVLSLPEHLLEEFFYTKARGTDTEAARKAISQVEEGCAFVMS
jgi:hypothetical protein